MFKIIFLIVILFIFITIYSFKKKIDNVIDSIFPPKEKKDGKKELEELIKCANCDTYIPKSEAYTKITFTGQKIYFCSQKCKEEYKKKK